MRRAVAPLATRLRDRALLRRDFVLRSGATSDIYFDKYRSTTDPALLASIIVEMAALVRDDGQRFDLIVAPELGAVPLATALSLELDLPFAIVREERKSYGSARRIEGTPIEPGSAALLVEDVVTSGGAALEAIAVAREAGATIDTCLCLLDRLEGGAAALSAAGVRLQPVLTMDELLVDR